MSISTRRNRSRDSARWCDRCEAFGNHHTDRHLCPECNGMSHKASCSACNGTGYQPTDTCPECGCPDPGVCFDACPQSASEQPTGASDE